MYVTLISFDNISGDSRQSTCLFTDRNNFVHLQIKKKMEKETTSFFMPIIGRKYFIYQYKQV
jgi:hypothetical protein